MYGPLLLDNWLSYKDDVRKLHVTKTTLLCLQPSGHCKPKRKTWTDSVTLHVFFNTAKQSYLHLFFCISLFIYCFIRFMSIKLSLILWIWIPCSSQAVNEQSLPKFVQARGTFRCGAQLNAIDPQLVLLACGRTMDTYRVKTFKSFPIPYFHANLTAV